MVGCATFHIQTFGMLAIFTRSYLDYFWDISCERDNLKCTEHVVFKFGENIGSDSAPS